LIARLVKLGIVAAAGHSSAKDEHVLAAVQVGLHHVTHIWSAMSSTIREGPWRKPGLLESALLFDDLTVEMIADNKHLPATLMKLAYKCIGADRLCAISDATSGAGLPEGTPECRCLASGSIAPGRSVSRSRPGRPPSRSFSSFRPPMASVPSPCPPRASYL